MNEISSIDLNENHYVVKANKFIEAKGRLGVTEQKLLAALICNITPADEDFKEYKLNIREIGEFIGLENSDVYERIKDASDNLLQKTLTFEEVDQRGRKAFLKMGLISSARYQEGDGELILKISPDLKPYLIAINGKKTPFTKYMIRNILKLTGTYSPRLYEILKQWQKIGIKKFELEELKESLNVEAKSYDIFSEFERNILKISTEEINELTDVFIEYEKLKTGRRITHIEFKITNKYYSEDQEIYIDYLNKYYKISEMKEKMGLKNLKLNTEQIMNLYQKAVEKAEDINQFEYIRLNYLHIKTRARNDYGYLMDALENDYAGAAGQISLDYYIE